MSPPVNPNDLTRHQLDELDALLQRMLSLPLGGSGATAADGPAALTMPDIPPVPGGTWRSDAAPAHRLPHTPAVMSDANTVTPSAWGPDPLARYTPPPAAPSSTPANFHVPALPPPSVEVVAEPAALFGPPDVLPMPEARTLRGVDAPANARPEPVADVVLTPAPAPTVTASVAPPSAAMFAPARDADAEPVPTAAWPVYALNGLIESALDACGPAGRVFTYRGAKQLLGWCGVALIAASAAWAARGTGLIDFPLPSTASLAAVVGR